MRKPLDTPFRQQRLKAWQPILTPKWVITTFFVGAAVFIPIGVAALLASRQVIEVTQQYYPGVCADPSPPSTSNCSLTITVPSTMKAPVYFYYQLENYYQNHRRYIKSRSDQQLRGYANVGYSSVSDCDPILNRPNKTCDGTDANCINPCGLIAWSVFNDTFALKSSAGSALSWDSSGIAWKSDVDYKFKNRAECLDSTGAFVYNVTNGCFQDVTDETFIVWMRTAGLPTFRKLHKIIRSDVAAGTYTVDIAAGYPVGEFNGKKSVILSTTTWIGGKNDFIGIVYLVVGCVCFALGALFLLKHLIAPRKLGDTKYMLQQTGAEGNR